ncbi:hypothetical protein HPK19_04655 [Arthrobacter citreus]|nr:hypothetical protein HPK19_04655 [Arthrobacter citreus]
MANFSEEVIKAVHQFWTDHKDAPSEWRSQLVENFTKEWEDRVNLSKPIMKHPSLRLKSYRRSYSVLEILTDFILDIKQVAEWKEEYPLYNAEKEYRTERQDESKILYIADKEEESRGLSYTVSQEKIMSRSIEDILFAEYTAESVPELTALILTAKQLEDIYVIKYEDPTRNWNEDNHLKKRTATNIKRAIRKLDVNRVKECKECGGAFYANDLRQIVCDSQRVKENELSMCQIKFKKKRDVISQKARKNADLAR